MRETAGGLAKKKAKQRALPAKDERRRGFDVAGRLVTITLVVMFGFVANILWRRSIALGLIATAVFVLVILRIAIWFINRASDP